MSKDRIPIDWPSILTALLILGISVFCTLDPCEYDLSPFARILAVFLAAAMLRMMWGSLRSYELDKRGIHIHHCGRYCGTLRWDQVQQLGILLQERQHRRGISQLYLVVIPKGVEPFAPDMETGYGYLSRNRRQLIQLDIKYAPMLEKYYGPLDFDIRNYSKR